MEKNLVLGIGFVILFTLSILTIAIYSQTTGQVVEFEEAVIEKSPEDSFFSPPSSIEPFPDKARTFESPKNSECEDSKIKRDVFCQTLTERFSGSCNILNYLKGCNLIKELCFENQQKVNEFCSLSNSTG